MVCVMLGSLREITPSICYHYLSNGDHVYLFDDFQSAHIEEMLDCYEYSNFLFVDSKMGQAIDIRHADVVINFSDHKNDILRERLRDKGAIVIDASRSDITSMVLERVNDATREGCFA